jgi:hypothetical protein
LSLTGCGPQPAPKSNGAATRDLATLLADLDRQASEIEKAMTAGDTEAADGPIHAVGATVVAIPKAARAEGIEGEQLSEIESGAVTLMAAYDKIHEGMHDGSTETAYDEVADSIKKGLKQIKDAAGK